VVVHKIDLIPGMLVLHVDTIAQNKTTQLSTISEGR
jgi:hypothetical protein